MESQVTAWQEANASEEGSDADEGKAMDIDE